jgi:hypothetical protein
MDFSIGDWSIAVGVVREPFERPQQWLEEVYRDESLKEGRILYSFFLKH